MENTASRSAPATTPPLASSGEFGGIFADLRTPDRDFAPKKSKDSAAPDLAPGSRTKSRFRIPLPSMPRFSLPMLRFPDLRIWESLRGFFEDVPFYLRRIGPDFSRSGSARLIMAGTGVLMVFVPIFFLLSLIFPALILPESPSKYLGKISGVQPNFILDNRGDVIAELFTGRTGNLRATELPTGLKKKLIFIEDKNFYEHGGIHWPSIGRAFLTNLKSFGYRQGGSTLTQQLARILLKDRSRSLLRKFKEMTLTYYLEEHLSKEQILAAYMNHVYLGHGASGIDVASKFYFDKGVDDLNFVEELILVSLPSAPERYSPLRNPTRLEKKMDIIYARMRKENFSSPGPVQYASLKIETLHGLNKSPSASVFGGRINDAPYIAEHIRLQISRILGKKYQYDSGLRIETSIDGRLQRKVNKISAPYIRRIASWVRPVIMKDGQRIRKKGPASRLAKFYRTAALGPVLFGHPSLRDDLVSLQLAAAGVDPDTGAILFLQGGSEFKPGNQFNRAIHMRRQTGSAIKPVIYAAAIDSGIMTAASMLSDRPIYSRRRRPGPGPEYWLPGNYGGVYEGQISVRRALAYSKNIPAILTARKIGLDRVGEYFQKFFFPDEKRFRQRFRKDETIAIGSLEMSPLEMAVAFAAFASNGIVRSPYLIRRIKDASGKVIFDGRTQDEFNFRVPIERRAISGDTAHVMYSILRQSGSRGGIRRGGNVGSSYMGKTGTTNDFRDAWFVGAVPGVSAAVWIGYDNPKYSMSRATGSSVAGPFWGRILSNRKSKQKTFHFSPHAKRIVICEDSGLLPRNSCPHRKKELFTHRSIPKVLCDLHGEGKKKKSTRKSKWKAKKKKRKRRKRRTRDFD